MIRGIPFLSQLVPFLAGCQNTVKKGVEGEKTIKKDPEVGMDAGSFVETDSAERSDSRDDVSDERVANPPAPATSPHPSPFVCQEGETRNCGTCDLGTQVCRGGVWRACDFRPPTEGLENCDCHQVVGRHGDAGFLFILDASGSMDETYYNGERRYDAAVQGIRTVLNAYGDRVDFGILVFPRGNDCSIGIPQVPVGIEPMAIADTLSRYAPNGQTPLAEAIQVGNRSLAEYRSQHPNHVVGAIILSDGGESCDGDPVTSLNDLLNAGFRAYLLDSSGGGLADVAAALNNPQRVYDVTNSVELIDALNSILDEVTIFVPYLEEVCNGADDDCDGDIDEHFDSVRERCDFIDNDCDGETDEGFGVRESCTQRGDLTKAYKTCSEDGESTVCVVPDPPVPVRMTKPSNPLGNHTNLGTFDENDAFRFCFTVEDHGEQISCTGTLKNVLNNTIYNFRTPLERGLAHADGREICYSFNVMDHLGIKRIKPNNRFTISLTECENEVGDVAPTDLSTTFYIVDNAVWAYTFDNIENGKIVDITGHGHDLLLHGNTPDLLVGGGILFQGGNYAKWDGEQHPGFGRTKTFFWLQFDEDYAPEQTIFTLGSVVGENAYKNFLQSMTYGRSTSALEYYGRDGTITQLRTTEEDPIFEEGCWQPRAITINGEANPEAIKDYVDSRRVATTVLQNPPNVVPQEYRPVGFLLGGATTPGGSAVSGFDNGRIRQFVAYSYVKTDEGIRKLSTDIILPPEENLCH